MTSIGQALGFKKASPSLAERIISLHQIEGAPLSKMAILLSFRSLSLLIYERPNLTYAGW